jgi:PadR family transcriptional regulator PadR
LNYGKEVQMTERLNKMRMELRRGVLVLAVLAVLKKEEYGYSLRKRLIAQGLDIEEGTLYPLIRRLESYGLLSSRWQEGDGRKKRYYKITTEGKKMLKDLSREWYGLNESIGGLLEPSSKEKKI